jgi:hypothetical protein
VVDQTFVALGQLASAAVAILRRRRPRADGHRRIVTD